MKDVNYGSSKRKQNRKAGIPVSRNEKCDKKVHDGILM